MMLARPPEFIPLPATSSLTPLGGDVSRAGAVARDYVSRIREEAHQRHDRGGGGRAVVAAFTDAIDRLLGFLVDEATGHYQSRSPQILLRCAVVAQGGYGRGELNPFSDIDLVFLYPWKLTPYVETLGEIVLYALWDAGLAVGHAMRNPRECLRLAAQDLTVKTALLDARRVCGDAALFEDFAREMAEDLRTQSPTPFVRAKLAESAARRARAGGSVYLLQPDVKEGQGGLRDLHTALWVASVKFKVHHLRDLIPIGVVSEHDVDEIETAVDFLFRVRNAMHFAAGAHQDQLTFELQEQLAPALGYGPGPAGEEAFMRAYFEQATAVDRLTEAIIRRSTETPQRRAMRPPVVRTVDDGMAIQGRQLSVRRDRMAREPAIIVRAFGEAQRHGVTLAPTTLEHIRALLPLLRAHHADPAVSAAFLEVLRAPGHVDESLEEMHRLGVLSHLIPEFSRLDCLISHDPFHVYTVDYHSLMGVRELERLRSGAFAAEVALLTQVMQEVPQPELLFLGMLFHDIGKGEGHDHDARGAAMARAICLRLGLNVDEQATVEFLVQHHLLMSHLAQRRDIHDEQLVVDFCRTVGTVENLQRLYALTFADMRAVNPKVWNNWRDALLRELYELARTCFDTATFEAGDRGARATRIRSRVLAAVPAGIPDAARFAATLPESYLLSTPEASIIEHLALRQAVAEREAAGEPLVLVTRVVRAPDRAGTEFAVCTRDRPGLFAMLTGVLASHGLNILAARISTSTDGIALDTFRISDVGGDPIDAERWERVEQTLRRVLAGEITIDALVERFQRSRLMTRTRRRVVTAVDIDNDVSRDYTVLDVSTWDRVGLLFTITNCLYHLWLEIHLAKITTMVDRVLDVFYVTDNEGRKITDPERLAHIQAELTRVVAGNGDRPAAQEATP